MCPARTRRTILSTLGLTTNVSGHRKYPFPQGGRNSDGSYKGKPSDSTSDTLWTGYVNYVKGLSGTYKKKYGYRTLMDYLQEKRYDRSVSEDLWRTPHYPVQALKDGTSLFLPVPDTISASAMKSAWSCTANTPCQQKTFYDGDVNCRHLDRSDHVRLYARSTPSRSICRPVSTTAGPPWATAFLKAASCWWAIRQRSERSRLLALWRPADDHRDDRRPDQPEAPSGWAMPSGFKWTDWTDYDGNGAADYTTTDINKKYAFWEATEAIKRGITIHTITVGADADRDLMKAIAFAGKGIFIDVPGGSTIGGCPNADAGRLQPDRGEGSAGPTGVRQLIAIGRFSPRSLTGG